MSVRTGARAPAQFILDLAPEDVDDVDLSTVASAVLHVRLPNQTFATWDASLSEQSATALTLTHVYAADGSDLPIPGPYSVFARLAVPGGHLDSTPVSLPVKDSFDATSR